LKADLNGKVADHSITVTDQLLGMTWVCSPDCAR